MTVSDRLRQIEAAGNLRTIPADSADSPVTDLSSNDYLGLAADLDLRERFLADHTATDLLMTSSASRLLAAPQRAYARLEQALADSYGRPTLLFNSGYHANTGIMQALGALPSTIIVADKLIHASIIDGIRLSGAPFERFRHNDVDHLGRLLAGRASAYSRIIVAVESVYSMDGDTAPLADIAALCRRHGAMLMVDEAHAAGVCGPAGLGCCSAEGIVPDILVGTLGKALASSGAYAVTATDELRTYLVNTARSLIFSTALPPAQAEWSLLTWQASLEGDWRRDRLADIAMKLADIIPGGSPSHIRPLIAGSADRAVGLSRLLAAQGYKALPIRTPTVPAGTERLRFSLSASIDPSALDGLEAAITQSLSAL